MDIKIRDLQEDESKALGQLLIDVYSKLEGFPTPAEQPNYYQSLGDIGEFAKKNQAHVFVAVSDENELLGGVVYFGDMTEYGAAGEARLERNASGIRLLGVSEKARGLGVGSALTQHCIDQARKKNHQFVILHTTKAMQVAWDMYAKLGFKRAEHLDFLQKGFPVFGFKLCL